MNHLPEQRFDDDLDALRVQKRDASPDPQFVTRLELQLQKRFSPSFMHTLLHSFVARRRLSVSIAATALVVVLAIVLWPSLRPGSPSGTVDPIFHKLVIQEAQAQEHFVLAPTDHDSQGVALTTAFRLVSISEVSCDDVAASLAISPKVDVEVRTISPTECEVAPKNPLDRSTLYRVALGATVQTSDGTDAKRFFRWSYQTKNELEMVTSIPRDKATGVPIDTGIDLTFSTDRVFSLDKYFAIEPATRGRFEQHGRTWSFVPEERLSDATLYTITVSSGLPVRDSSVALSDDIVFRFETAATRDTDNQYVPPFSEAFTAVRPDEAPVIKLSLYGTEPENGKASVFAFADADDLITRMKAVDSLPSWAYYSRQNATIDTNGMRKIGEFDLLKENGALTFPSGFSRGYYLVEVPFGKKILQTPLVVSPLGAALTLTGDSTALWLYDVTTDAPISNATITTSVDDTRASTNSTGLAQFTTPTAFNPGSDGLSLSRGYVRVTTADGRDTLVPVVPEIPFFYGFGYSFGGVRQQSDAHWSYLWTDRTLYRPNDTINVWGVLRDRKDLAKNLNVEIEVWTYEFLDANGEYIPVATATSTTSDYGTYAASLPVSALKPGYYTLGVSVDGRRVANRSFEVHTFQKPAYQIVASVDKVAVIDGDTVTYDIQTQFFDGTPAPRVHLRYAGNGRSGDAGTDITTDESGRASFSKKLHYGDGNHHYAASEQLTFFPADGAEGDISASTNVMILPAAVTFTPTVEQDGHTATIDLTVTNVDLENFTTPWESYGYSTSPYIEKLLEGSPAPKAPIDGTVYEVVTTKTKTGTVYDFLEKKVVDTYYYETHNEKRDTFSGVTDKNGHFEKTLTLPGETYLIDIAAQDLQGRKIVRTVWVDTRSYPSGELEGATYEVRDANNPRTRGYSSSALPTKDYAIGDRTRIQFLKDGEAVENTGAFLFIKLQNGIRDTQIVDASQLEVTFAEEDAPNVHYSVLWYHDGRFIAPTNTHDLPSLVFRKELRRLTVTVTPGKASYAPGETAKLSIDVRDVENNPVQARVNLSAIDEALATIQWDNPPVPLESLYRPLRNGILQQYVSHAPLALESGAEGGGGGDGERKNFRDAPLFTEVETGKNGKASVEFVVPDNITSWRITSQAVTKELYAGQTVIGLPVTKPVFGVLTMNDEYVVNDKPVILAHAYGTALDEGNKVSMKLEIPALGISEERNVDAFTEERFVLESLQEGNLDVRLTVEKGKNVDTLIRTIRVLPSRLSKVTSVGATVKEGMTFTSPSGGRSTLLFSDEGRGRLLTTFETLQWSYGKRLDRSLAAVVARDGIRRLNNAADINTAEFHPEAFQQDDGGVSLVTYGSSELRLSAFAAARGDLFDHSRLEEYFTRTLTSTEASLEEVGYALYGLAQLGLPMLADLDSYLARDGITDEDRLVAALAYHALGADDKAYTIAQSLLETYGESQDPYIRLKLGASNDAHILHTAEFSILAEGLKLPERLGVHAFLAVNFPKDTITNLERALALTGAIPNLDDQAVSFTFRLRGETKEVALATERIHVLSLSAEDLATFEVLKVQGPVGVVHSYREAITIDDEPRDTRLSINRTYALQSGEKRAITQGDIVKITLTPKVAAGVVDKSFLVIDELPSGLVLLTSPWERGIPFDQEQGYPIEYDGQRVTFYTSGKKAFHYYARVLTPGIFAAEPATLQGENSRDIVNYSGGQSLEIR